MARSSNLFGKLRRHRCFSEFLSLSPRACFVVLIFFHNCCSGCPGESFFLFFTCLSLLSCLLSARVVKSKFEVHLLGEPASSSPSFRSAFAPRGIPSPEFPAWCTGATSSLAFRPAFPPGRITAPEFRALCKHGSSISACFSACISSRKNHISGIPSFLQARELHLRVLFGRHFLQEASRLQNSKLTASTATLFRLLILCANLNIYANEVWYIQSTISNCFPYQTWGFFLRSILQCCQR